jgi:hypothetical protein
VLTAPRTARANSGDTFLETIGIGIAVGTVLGASTLPFYDQPGTHFVNLAYGAGAGAAVGIGVVTYGWLTGSKNDEQAKSPAETSTLVARPNFRPTQRRQILTPQLPPTTILWSPIVSVAL